MPPPDDRADQIAPRTPPTMSGNKLGRQGMGGDISFPELSKKTSRAAARDISGGADDKPDNGARGDFIHGVHRALHVMRFYLADAGRQRLA